MLWLRSSSLVRGSSGEGCARRISGVGLFQIKPRITVKQTANLDGLDHQCDVFDQPRTSGSSSCIGHHCRWFVGSVVADELFSTPGQGVCARVSRGVCARMCVSVCVCACVRVHMFVCERE